ncbi:DUF342 domain-containing protein [Lacrimispora sp.]|uniref:DUF342 domain-containing protein n=1 Tax=Lacrimispora sp. TaxID=2719234 RepID=UPI002FDA7CDD
MKEKNRKGLFGLFQNAKRSSQDSEEAQNSSAVSLEEAVKETFEETPIGGNDQTSSSATPLKDDEPAVSSPSIWEPSDDPLLIRINEDVLNIECSQFTTKTSSLSNVFKRTASVSQEGEGTEPTPRDAQPHLYISKDGMAAWIYVIPPFNNGRDISEKDLRAVLSQNRVKTGILEDAFQSIANDLIYDQSVLVAKGTLARNGVDGSINDRYKRVLHLEFEEDEKGSVDYKHLNNIQSIKEGEAICEITRAVPGQNGITVTGIPYPCTIKGTEFPVPVGRNTVLNKEGTLLISQKTGHVTFANGKFHVDPILKINGNIDNSTGNLDYDGDIFISGDVRNGFSIKATGSIDIRGSVEGAVITAGGPITIASGMSGNGKGVLTSESHIKCRYLEHCTVSAGGNVYAESIINSKVKCGQDIVVTSGMGAIIGGTLLAASNINARIIGSKVRRLITELVIANIPKSVEESEKLTRELEQLHYNMSEVKKNINYLENSQRADKEQLLERLKQAEEYLNIREQGINNRLEEIAADTAVQTGLIQCQQLLPVVRIRMGASVLLIQEEYSKSLIYKNNEGEIVIGSN